MFKAFEYRFRPTKKQESLMNQTLDECRWLYKHLLEQRKTRPRHQRGSSPSRHFRQGSHRMMLTINKLALREGLA